MTDTDAKIMAAEDNELARMMGKGPSMEVVKHWKLVSHDQPALYVKAEEPQVDEDAITAYYEPVIEYGVPKRLIESFKAAALPLAIVVLAWALWQSGDASKGLALAVIVPAAIIAVAGAMAPWFPPEK